MLSGITSYFFGSAEEEAPGSQDVKLRVTPVDDEWALVDRSNCAFSCVTVDGNCPCSLYNTLGSHDNDMQHPCSDSCSSRDASSSSSGRNPCGDNRHIKPIGATNNDTISPCKMEESWLVEPPSCFTTPGGRSQSPQHSSLENLLLEHPSMSVYNSSTTNRGRPSSTGIESDTGSGRNSPSTVKGRTITKPAARRPQALSQRVGLLPQTQLMVKSMQMVKRKVSVKSTTRNHFNRGNKSYNLRSMRRQVRVQQPKKTC